MNQGADVQQIAAPKMPPEAGVDPELIALPAPPKRERTVAVVLMLVTTLASLAMCWAMRREVAYAFARTTPTDLGDLHAVATSSLVAGTYAEAQGMLGTQGAIRYSRPLETDSFRLQPAAGNPKLWVEIRVPAGMEGPRFIPPANFAGRLVPMEAAGLRHAGLARSIRNQSGVEAPPDSWLLIDGASPKESRWAVALFALFGFFAVWNLGEHGPRAAESGELSASSLGWGSTRRCRRRS